MRNLFKKILVVTFLFAVSPFVASLELSTSLYSDISYSNNIKRSSTNTVDDVSQTVGLSVVMLEKRKRFNADASFKLEEKHFYKNTFENQTSLTTGFGIFNFDIIENFLNWRTSFTRTQVLRSAFDNDTPDNRENRNILRSGPSITYRINRESSLAFSANYTNVENSDVQSADTERINGVIGYSYAFNSTTSLSLNSQYDEIFDADGGAELKNTNINFGLVRQIAQGQLAFNYGRTKTRSDLSDAVTGNFFDIGFVRKQVYWHDLSVQYREDLSDTSIGFEADEEGFENSLGESEGEAGSALSSVSSHGVGSNLDVVKRKRLNVSMSRVLGRYQYELTGFWENEVYEALSNDSIGRGFSLALNQNIVPDLRVGLSYSFVINDYLDQPLIGKDRTGTYRLSSKYGLTPELDVSGFLGYEIRMNSSNQVREYEVFSTGLTLYWALL